MFSGTGTGVPLQRAHPVTLARAATVAASLRETVEPTFGPMGGDRLMVNDANQIIITNSGQLILEVRRAGRRGWRSKASSVRPDHPPSMDFFFMTFTTRPRNPVPVVNVRRRNS